MLVLACSDPVADAAEVDLGRWFELSVGLVGERP